jgi:hypothetical protein
MIKQNIITFLFLLVAMTGQGQKIKMNEPSFSDYLPLLNNKGYMAYSFNTKKFKGADVEPIVMEYVKGEEPKNALSFNVIMSLGKKLIIGFMPSDNDSIASFHFNFGENRGFSSRLKLQPTFAPENPEEKWYMYQSRPFELTASIEKGKFIPLVLYGSYWYDPKACCCRFCGDNEIKPDLSSDIVEFIPHFFVLGIKIK